MNDEHACVACEDGMEEFETKMRNIIAEFGHGVIAVSDVPSFAYTVGRWDKGLPEIIVFGLNPQVATIFLNDVAALDPFPECDTRIDCIAQKYDVMLREVSPVYADEYLCQTARFNTVAIGPILQLMLTDKENRFPFEEGFDENFRLTMPVLDRPSLQ